mmetsp:Transcript_42023/g.164609  ORF Transcript_42023/g.164609 Transcript_42023/m.164609 type:complete len:82 (-) Transcript_42023:216-461(-)
MSYPKQTTVSLLGVPRAKLETELTMTSAQQHGSVQTSVSEDNSVSEPFKALLDRYDRGQKTSRLHEDDVRGLGSSMTSFHR